MNLHTGHLLWTDLDPQPPTYPTVTESLSCEVMIIGGGIAGALCAYFLAEHNIDTILVEKRHIANGSTRGNTGLLQYMNDKPLHQLAAIKGLPQARRYYQACREAVDLLESITQQLSDETDYVRRPTLYYATNAAHVPPLEREYELLTQNGFPVQKLAAGDIRERFSFEKSLALYNEGDATVNPYRLSHALIRRAAQISVRPFEHTEVSSVFHEQGHVCARTQHGPVIRAKRAIFCTGYETQQRYKTPGARLSSTYAIATEPVTDAQLARWHERCLIWETARPYLYMRITPDNRILVGGLDASEPEGHKRDRLLPTNAEQLLTELTTLFPSLAGTNISHSWGSTFCSTVDGLPCVGRHPQFHDSYYVLGYGGNGTVYSIIAAQIVRDLITKGDHPDAHLFDLERMR